MEKRTLILGIVMVLILTCCKDLKPQKSDDSTLDEDSLELADSLTGEESMDELISEAPMPVAAEELFDDFLFNFASNKRLQMERVKFPIIVSSEAKA